jgi:hypothetical protein
MLRLDAEVMSRGKFFQTVASAAGIALAPIVDSRIRGTGGWLQQMPNVYASATGGGRRGLER